MVKFGKEYRALQLDEWKKYYINYKALKKKIKEIKDKIYGKRKKEEPKERKTRTSVLSLPLMPEEAEGEGNLSTLYQEQNGELLKEFIELLLTEFKKSYSFFTGIEKVLIKKINTHLYIQTNYPNYSLLDLTKEMKSLSLTVYLAKCLNGFVNDIMMAMKKILKKFDKKFSSNFGLITPNLILHLLSKKNSELEYVLQFKIIDEISTIGESLTYELKSHFDQNNEEANEENNKNREEFLTKFEDTLGYIKDIDELIYFKTQYKDWLDYIRGIKSSKKSMKNLENDIFNPILSSSYYNDNLLDKFLSTKEAHQDVSAAQNPISKENNINIILVYLQTFVSNSLFTSIFPFLYYYLYMNAWKNEENGVKIKPTLPYESLLINVFNIFIVGATYVGYFLSTFIFYNYFATKKIKLSFIISDSLLIVGSIMYILSVIDGQGYFKKRSVVLGISRLLIGLGSNSIIGKKYISLYAPKYSLPTISKIYLLFEILGLVLGPLLTVVFSFINLGAVISIFNCVGWYGAFISIVVLVLHILLFKQPIPGEFCIVQNQENLDVNASASKISQQVFEEEDSQDREFYKMQKEAAERKKQGLEPTKSDDVKIETNDMSGMIGSTKSKPNFEKDGGEFDAENVKQIIGEAGEALGDNQVAENYYNNVDTERYSNLKLGEEEQRDTIKNIEAKLYEYQEKSNFTYINMMPRIIDDIVIKEQKTFGYMNRNLFIMFVLLFVNNIIKENYIVFSPYYLLFNHYREAIDNYKDANLTSLDVANQYISKIRYISIIFFAELILQIPSLFFIMPFYKVNLLYKKNLIIYMIATVVLMLPLCFPWENLYVYIPLVASIIAINKIIEVTSSCYLVYLIPPQWKFLHFKAGRIPTYILVFARFGGCMICLTAFYITETTWNWNQIIITIAAGVFYGIFGSFIYKSENFRVKALSRVLRKRVVE